MGAWGREENGEYEGYEGDGVKPRRSERWKRDERGRKREEKKRREERRGEESRGKQRRTEETRRDREHGRPVSTGVCMMGEAPPRLEFPLGLVLAI